MISAHPFFFLSFLCWNFTSFLKQKILVVLHKWLEHNYKKWDLLFPDKPEVTPSVHGILQARILEWVAISFSRGCSRPRGRTRVFGIAGRHYNLWATREAKRINCDKLTRAKRTERREEMMKKMSVCFLKESRWMSDNCFSRAENSETFMSVEGNTDKKGQVHFL